MVTLQKKHIIVGAAVLAVIALLFLVRPMLQGNSSDAKNNTTKSATATMGFGTVIDVPGDWEVSQRSDLPKNAVFAILKDHDMGVIVQEEAKKDLPKEGLKDMSLEKYAAFVRDAMARDMQEPTVSPATHVALGDKDCLRFDISGIQEDLHIRYSFTMCDLGTAFLRAAAWGNVEEFAQQQDQVDAFMDGIHW